MEVFYYQEYRKKESICIHLRENYIPPRGGVEAGGEKDTRAKKRSVEGNNGQTTLLINLMNGTIRATR